MLKGYYTDSAYWGWIGDRYIENYAEKGKEKARCLTKKEIDGRMYI